MDKKIFRDISYGMYIVTSRIDSKFVGCVINTLCQINSVDPLVSISLNHDNYTNEVIKKNKLKIHVKQTIFGLSKDRHSKGEFLSARVGVLPRADYHRSYKPTEQGLEQGVTVWIVTIA